MVGDRRESPDLWCGKPLKNRVRPDRQSNWANRAGKGEGEDERSLGSRGFLGLLARSLESRGERIGIGDFLESGRNREPLPGDLWLSNRPSPLKMANRSIVGIDRHSDIGDEV